MTGTITISSPPAAEAKAALAAAEQSLSNAEELIERLRDSITAAQEAAADARRERKKLTLPAARGDRAAGERLKDLRKQEFDCEAQVADAAFAVEEAERERDAARDAVLRAKKAVTLAHALEVGAELVRQGADIDRILGELVPAMRRHDELVIELLALRVVDHRPQILERCKGHPTGLSEAR